MNSGVKRFYIIDIMVISLFIGKEHPQCVLLVDFFFVKLILSWTIILNLNKMDPIGNKPYGFMGNPKVLRSYFIFFKSLLCG